MKFLFDYWYFIVPSVYLAIGVILVIRRMRRNAEHLSLDVLKDLFMGICLWVFFLRELLD